MNRRGTLEQRFLTPDQVEAKYGRERKASIMRDGNVTEKPLPKSVRGESFDKFRTGSVES